MQTPSVPRDLPIGLIACGGTLPREVADSIVRGGRRVFVVAVDEEADADFGTLPVVRVSWSKFGAAVAALRAAGVRDVLMVGRMTRPRLKDARPDFGFIAALPTVLKILTAGGDDALLRSVVALFEPRGFRVVGVADVAADLLLSGGHLAGPAPSVSDQSDIELGMALIAALGPFDIGQGAIVANGRVIALEGAEGTDRMIARVAAQRAGSDGSLAKRSGVLIKRAKPGQDVRLDLPTIGPDTVTAVDRAGLSGIAAQQGHVIVAHRAELMTEADRLGIFVVGVDGMTPHVEASLGLADVAAQHGALRNLSSSDRRDAGLGIAAMLSLLKFSSGCALVARRNRVISIGAHESAFDVITRTYPARRGWMKSRTGVSVISGEEMLSPALLQAAANIGLAAVIVMIGSGREPQSSQADLEVGQRYGLSIIEVACADFETAP
ncbi:MAG: hypothetical protein CTY31_01740 [Hyphomicrobium sp.]|nr:MAG: hypothetical protein CTY31_01740 [Hyphomicrobium sp.]